MENTVENTPIPYASIKPTAEILNLFEQAKYLDVDGLGNAEILERALQYIKENKENKEFQIKKFSKRKKEKVENETKLPSSFKVRKNDEALYKEVSDFIAGEFKVSRIMTPFLLRISLTAYIDYLENEFKEENIENEEASTPEPISNLVEEKIENKDANKIEVISLILNASDEKISEILDILKSDCEE